MDLLSTILQNLVGEFLRIANALAVVVAAIATWIAARSTRAALRANQIAGKALRTQYVPWVNIDRAEISTCGDFK
jgi:hypothetical protein